MAIREAIGARFRRSGELFVELSEAIPESALGENLEGLPSNTLGQQLWCVVGARESYARAIEAGGWQGFACSLTAEQVLTRSAVSGALRSSAAATLRAVAAADAGDEARWGLVLDLLEHEAAHQGQLIRYLYALRLPIPAGWKSRWALD